MPTSAVLTAEMRDQKGKGPARRLRQKALIPAVVYGLDKAPSHLAVDPKVLEKAIATPHKFNTLLTLKTADGEKLVLFKDYQVDPVSRKLLHADFLEVTLDKPVKVEVPVVAVGKAEGVELFGDVVDGLRCLRLQPSRSGGVGCASGLVQEFQDFQDGYGGGCGLDLDSIAPPSAVGGLGGGKIAQAV